MSKAVQFDTYGELNVLKIVDVPQKTQGPNQVLVCVKVAGLNPGESKIREGMMESMFPGSFPSGQGTDFAGVIEAVGSEVSDFQEGDSVVGYTHNRDSQAEYVLAEAQNVTLKPDNVSWEVAGSLYVAGTTAYAAVAAVNLTSSDCVVVTAAGGGVGMIAVQLAKRTGATVIGIANVAYHDWLKDRGIIPIDYKGDMMSELEAATKKVDALIDTAGQGYVKMAIEMGVHPERINTIIDFAAAGTYHVKTEGSAEATGVSYLAQLLQMVSDGELVVPIAKSFKIDEVIEAYRYLEAKHEIGKVILTM